MPIYEFNCDDCQHPFEELVSSMSNQSMPACPNYGSKATRKQISLFSPGSAAQAAPESSCGMMPGGTCSRPGCGNFG